MKRSDNRIPEDIKPLIGKAGKDRILLDITVTEKTKRLGGRGQIMLNLAGHCKQVICPGHDYLVTRTITTKNILDSVICLCDYL